MRSTISLDWNDANLDGTFSAGERTGSVEYLIENSNFTGYQQTILETVKNAAGQAVKRTSYTFGLDEITQTVSELDPTSQLITQTSTLTFGHDGKGSVRVLFESSAAIAQVFTYSAYGELLAIHNGSGLLTPHTSPLTTYLYNGEGNDTRTGLYNMRARWYSPTNARWERLDPFAGNPTDPFSFHKYGFVHGEPVQGIDPSGENALFAWALSFAIVVRDIATAHRTMGWGTFGQRMILPVATSFASVFYASWYLVPLSQELRGLANDLGPGQAADRVSQGADLIDSTWWKVIAESAFNLAVSAVLSPWPALRTVVAGWNLLMSVWSLSELYLAQRENLTKVNEALNARGIPIEIEVTPNLEGLATLFAKTVSLQLDPAGIVSKARDVLRGVQNGQLPIAQLRDLARQINNDFGHLVRVKVQVNGRWEIL